jgi:subtilisin family serine protease
MEQIMKANIRTERNTFLSQRKIGATGFMAGILALGILAFLLLTGTALAQPAPQPPPDQPGLAPLLNLDLKNRIPDQYIVVFKPGTSREVVTAAQRRVKELDGSVGHTYSAALIGFSVKISQNGVQTLRAIPGVAYIEVDQVGNLNSVQPPNPSVTPPTGLDRTSERFLPLDTRYTYNETGNGVHVYVIDTGIRATHTEFGGRVSGGTNTMSASAGTDDCHGHGTHVAGTIGGASFGIAKQVFLHPVRAGDCANTYLSPVIAAVDWVTANRVLPAVVNLSSGFGNSPALNTAVTNSVTTGQVTYAVAAGNFTQDACNWSPALVPAAITVGSIDPTNDTAASSSNFGTCVDLYAPGINILSAGNSSDTATAIMSGTSMAAPHVAGVAARYLQTHPLAAPSAVWAAIHNADNIFGTTVGWPGLIGPGAGSPNELLHYGSLNDGMNDGEPHIATVNGIRYDFQPGGEFVALRDANGLEIQTRQTPVPTTPWVSFNTAVAARVGTHRVTWQPKLSGVPDSSGLQLRVDGVPRTLGASGIALGSGGRIVMFGKNGIEIDFPDGTALFVTSYWWPAQNHWYLDVHVFHTPATEGIMGVVAQDSWLMPQFTNTWRVTDRTSLFDYAANTSTATFTHPIFPADKIPPLNTEAVARAQLICRPVTDRNLLRDCVFDVARTGDPIFAKATLINQQVQRGATSTTVYEGRDSSQAGEKVKFTAIVAPQAQAQGRRIPTGSVQLTLDGQRTGDPLRLDRKGQAYWIATDRMTCGHRVAAYYIPDNGSDFLPSSSFDVSHTAVGIQCGKAEKATR